MRILKKSFYNLNLSIKIFKNLLVKKAIGKDYLIDHFDHPNQKILAERLNITPATLSVRLQRLEKAGFIEKVVSRHDKRNVSLHITEKGKNEIKSCKDDMKMFTTRLFGGINKEDLDRMKTYCQIFEKNIRLMKEELDVQD